MLQSSVLPCCFIQSTDGVTAAKISYFGAFDQKQAFATAMTLPLKAPFYVSSEFERRHGYFPNQRERYLDLKRLLN